MSIKEDYLHIYVQRAESRETRDESARPASARAHPHTGTRGGAGSPVRSRAQTHSAHVTRHWTNAWIIRVMKFERIQPSRELRCAMGPESGHAHARDTCETSRQSAATTFRHRTRHRHTALLSAHTYTIHERPHGMATSAAARTSAPLGFSSHAATRLIAHPADRLTLRLTARPNLHPAHSHSLFTSTALAARFWLLRHGLPHEGLRTS